MIETNKIKINLQEDKTQVNLTRQFTISNSSSINAVSSSTLTIKTINGLTYIEIPNIYGTKLTIDEENNICLLGRNENNVDVVLSKVELPQDNYINNAYYDKNQKELVLEFVNDEIIKVPLDFNDSYSKDEIDTKITNLYNDINTQIENINKILSSNDVNLDTLQELVNALKDNVSDISDIFNELSKKVDKVDGYGLSKNDLTDELLNKLTSLENYDDTEIQKKIAQIELILTSDDTDLDTLQELVNALKNNVASIGDIFTELAKKANSSDIPTKVSQLENDSGYLTEHQDISGKADKEDVYTREETDTKIEELKQNISLYSQSFTGTIAEYKLAEENGLITNGMILFIIDDDETTLEDDGSTSSILGKGKLGYMLLA